MAELIRTPLINDVNLKAYYRLENVNDTTSNAFNLTNNGTTLFVPVKYANGADFGAGNSSKFLSIANNLGINNTSSGASTFGGWFVFYDSNTAQTLIGHSRNGGRQWEFNVNGNTLFLQSYDGATPQAVNSTKTNLTSGVLYFLAMTANGNSISFYCNGDACGTGTLTTNANTVAADSFTIGRHPTVSAGLGLFKADDCFAFNRVLTPSEIMTIYKDNLGGSILLNFL